MEAAGQWEVNPDPSQQARNTFSKESLRPSPIAKQTREQPLLASSGAPSPEPVWPDGAPPLLCPKTGTGTQTGTGTGRVLWAPLSPHAAGCQPPDPNRLPS